MSTFPATCNISGLNPAPGFDPIDIDTEIIREFAIRQNLGREGGAATRNAEPRSSED
jgi:hypothetical protein